VESPCEVSVVMRYAVCWGVHQGARGARFEWQLEFGRVERHHRQKRGRIRLRSALQVWSLVMEQGPRSLQVACWFHATTVGQCTSMVVYWEGAHFVKRVLLFVVSHQAEGAQGSVNLVLRVCGQVGQVVAGVSLEVSEVMRDPVGGGGRL
jgi:hypothetical protein